MRRKYFWIRPSVELFNRHPGNFRKSLIDPQDAVLGVLEKDHCRCQIEEHPELGLLPPQRLLGLLALSNVAGNPRQTNQRAGGIPDLKTTVMNPTEGAIRTLNLILHAHLRYFFHQCRENGK